MSTQQNREIQHVVTETLSGIGIPASESLNYSFLNPEDSPPLSQHQPMQFVTHEGFNRQLTTEEMMAQTQAILRFSCATTSQIENCNMTKKLPFKTMIADMPWRQLKESEYKIVHQAPKSSLHTSAAHTTAQSVRAASVRQRIRWTYELHEQFVEAVNTLGGPMKATPKEILKLMKTEGLTVFHIKSHLQKYRTTMFAENMLEGKNGRIIKSEGQTSYALEYGKHQISETLRLQWELQKSLHDHLEFQRKLQMRIQVHANYLERMFEQQKRGCIFIDAHHSTESTILAEFSSIEEQQYPSNIASEIGCHREILE